MRIKSPLRLVVAILILLMLIYVGFAGAVSIISGEPIKFGFRSNVLSSSDTVQDFVVAGIDEEGYRTDLILFCRYNLNDNSINVLQIPRDTKVENDRYDKKINSAYGSSGKIQTMYDEIESVIGIRPEKHVIVSFKAFRELIDAIGGVEVNVPMRMYYTDPVQNLTIDLYPGTQLLNGRRSEMFMRFRYNNDGTGYPNGDIDRIAAQKSFYEAAMDKLLSGSTIFKAPKILSIIADNVKTDFTGEEIIKYIGRIPDFSLDKVNILTLPGTGDYAENGVSYFFHDQEATKALMEEHFTVKKTERADGYKGSLKNRFIRVRVIDATGIDNEKVDVLKAVADTLKDYGFNVVSAEKSDRILDTSKLVNHNQKMGATEVQKLYNSVEIATTIEEIAKTEGEKTADVTLKIGNDFSF